MRLWKLALLLLLLVSGVGGSYVLWSYITRYEMTAELPAGCFQPVPTLQLETGDEYVRTPEACFIALPDWPYEYRYVEIDELRQAYVEAGPEDGETILMLHGQPAWSYLYRFMIDELASRGYRVIAMDHLGFGRSDKPTDQSYYSFQMHAERLRGFIRLKELEGVTLFAQDWGSIIGLYVAAGELSLFDRIIIGNGGLPLVREVSVLPDDVVASNAQFERMIGMMPDNQPPLFDEDGTPLLPVGEGEGTEPFGQWVAYARTAEGFRPGLMVEALTFDALTAEERAAYDAPHPSEAFLAGPRSFPGLRDELLGITEARLEALTNYEQPFLTIFGGNDPGLVGEGDGQPWMVENIPGAAGQPHHRYPNASHFLQDDMGFDIADRVDSFMRETR